MTYAEWVEWLGLYRFDPWDDDRRDFMLAQATAAQWNTQVDKEYRKGPDAFLPLLATRRVSKPTPQNPDDVKARFKGLAQQSKRRGPKHR